ncbi:ROK family glucokinase [Aquiluna sp. KACHI24]|uniref:ROK family glucokinase n=1 Tax=Aquiluna sp. KACHI24 TaxID=2968831 RepID=UPI0021FF24D8|nr:ROK family glucokinase [Aquiluna sp. KACHI24]BDQ00167.1 glucokinase [Aquiluna sp. KACHI24]
MLAIGIDIGGTKIAGAVVSESGEILEELRVPSPAQDPDQMITEVVGLINQLAAMAPEQVVAAGVAAAGFIDADQSTILYAPNLNWRNEPFRDRLKAHLDLPVFIENDANAAGWAEFKFGAGKGTKDMVMLTLGTGVGGAVVADYKLRRGGFGIGGELGHVRVVQDGRQCGCGRKGCVEQYASGSAVLKAAKKLASSDGPAGERLRQLKTESGELTGHQVYQALLEGDAATRELVNQAGSYLGQAMGSITAVLDPQVFVIGGGLSEAGELILDPIRQSYLRELPARGFRPEAEIVTAKFSNQAGVIGAADLARESVG